MHEYGLKEHINSTASGIARFSRMEQPKDPSPLYGKECAIGDEVEKLQVTEQCRYFAAQDG